jgi:hypothetical protein
MSKTGLTLGKISAITPLLNVPRTEELLAARAAEVGVSSRTLHRWIAAYEGAPPSDTKLQFDFPAAALFVVATHFEGMSTRAIHQLLKSEWAALYPGKPCPCYTTLLVFIRSLSSAQVRP